MAFWKCIENIESRRIISVITFPVDCFSKYFIIKRIKMIMNGTDKVNPVNPQCTL
ncbi:MAG: hypothetical protein HY959_04450 [Ignavibacteriae bacterium]|nr:hypothetical protein [Ignavibacteriota bacterium]